MIRYFRKPMTWDLPIGFDFKHERALEIAKSDPVFYKHQAYELIGDAECYIPSIFKNAYSCAIGDGEVLKSDILIFRNVEPHIDENFSDWRLPDCKRVRTYYGHVFLHGSGVFKSYNSRANPDKPTSIIPFKPGTVILMNQEVRHSVDSVDGYIFTYCEERIFAE